MIRCDITENIVVILHQITKEIIKVYEKQIIFFCVVSVEKMLYF